MSSDQKLALLAKGTESSDPWDTLKVAMELGGLHPIQESEKASEN